MKYDLIDIKRKRICPVLYQNKWDYSVSPSMDSLYLSSIKEAFRWYYKRGGRIPSETHSLFMGRQSVRLGFNITQGIDTTCAMRNFLISGLYNRIDSPFFNKEVEIFLNKEDTIVHKIPCISKIKNKIVIITFDLGKVDKMLYLNMYETLFTSLWSFYVLDKIPVFYNLYLEKDKIVEDEIKIEINYIEKARNNLLNVGEELSRLKSLPPSEICFNCSRRKECLGQKTIKKKYKR